MMASTAVVDILSEVITQTDKHKYIRYKSITSTEVSFSHRWSVIKHFRGFIKAAESLLLILGQNQPAAVTKAEVNRKRREHSEARVYHKSENLRGEGRGGR